MERLSDFEGYSIRLQLNFILGIIDTKKTPQHACVTDYRASYTDKYYRIDAVNCTSMLEKTLNCSFPSNKRLSNFSDPEQVLVYFCFDLSSQKTFLGKPLPESLLMPSGMKNYLTGQNTYMSRSNRRHCF